MKDESHYERFVKVHDGPGWPEIFAMVMDDGSVAPQDHGGVQCATLDRIPFVMKVGKFNHDYARKT